MQKLSLFFIICLFFLFNCIAFADQVVNSKIIIKGNQRVDSETIRSYLDIKGLEQNKIQAINDSLKKIFESELFLDAKIYLQQNAIIIEVKENPIIGEVEFRGNKKIDSEVLLSEIKLNKRAVYTKVKLQADIKRINDIYIKSGRFLTTIEPKIVQRDQNRVDLIFDIKEGKKAEIAEINFIGNKNFSNQDLKDEITTKETKIYKLFSSSDSYDSDRIEFDKERLRKFYNANGYADFTVISAISQISPNKDKFFINFVLEEGIKYSFGEINIINKVSKFDESVLRSNIKTKKGKIYNGDLLDDTIDGMSKNMSERGYAFANIEPILKRDKDKKIIDIDYVINQTSMVYINKINIKGNTRTLDEVVRREMRVMEGDAYNINKINRSKQRIQNLDFFDKVEFSTKRIEGTNLVDLEVEVKEKKTGELSFGIGYSTVDQATANVGFKEKNLFGTGQELGVNIQKTSTTMSNEVNYTKPYFYGDIALGVDVFNYQLDKKNSLIYDQQSLGLTLKGDYSISEHLGHQVRYSLKNETISNVESTAAFSLQNLAGTYVNSGVGQSFFYDKINNRIKPTEGYYLSFSQDYSGVGGNVHYIKNEATAGYYLPILDNKEFVLKFATRFGQINGIGQDIKSNDNFFLGGNNFRGFQYAGIGPRSKSGDAIGGKSYYVGTTEIRFPLGLPKDLGISGSLFSDTGSLTGVDKINKNKTEIINDSAIRSSYGISFNWFSPLGPISLEFSKAAKKQYYDRTEGFRFSLGTNF